MSAINLTASERETLRDLARQVAAIAAKPVQNQRRAQWRDLNSLRSRNPLIHIRGGVMFNETIRPQCICRDPFYQQWEFVLRQSIYRDTFEDDFIIEPWLDLQAAYRLPEHGRWGFQVSHTFGNEPGGSYHMESAIKDYDDIDRLAVPFHTINEANTAAAYGQINSLLGDILPVVINRSPVYRIWNGDLSTNLGELRGIDQIMFDMMDNPAWLHDLVSRMRDGVLRAQQQAEDAGDWRLCASDNQSTPYSHELPDPSASPRPARRKELWAFAASQELTLVGPAQFEEFMLRYQIPILAHFGLVSYGCCEDLTRKIDLLRAIPNLRRIAVSPMANVAACAAQIRGDYVVSYRPSPADTVCCGFNEQRIRDILRRDINSLRANGCFFEINMKDIQTLQGEPDRIRRFVAIARDELAHS